MRSRAHYNGHPIHPALIPFPFAFLTGAFAFDALGWVLNNGPFWTTGGHLAIAGVVTALAAAVPGFIDYFYTVPPHSSGKQRATRHMLLNLAAVGIFAVAWLMRDPVSPRLAVVVSELLAVGLLGIAGSMGGVLVNRNQIGVDHRYAHAGKWKEAWLETRPDKTVLAAEPDELQVNQMKLLHVAGRRIVLARHEDGYAAFDDRCSHKGGSLAGGALICGTVQCPWHGSQFDVTTGLVKAGPAAEPIRCYPVEERNGRIHVNLAAPASLGA